jgi:cell wall assembly regulator SMI1
MSVRESWKRIADWYDGSPRRGLIILEAGATEGQLEALERAIGSRLPDDVRESYLLHNGTSDLLGVGEVMPLNRVEAMWQMYAAWQHENGYGLGPDWDPRDIEGPIKPIWWSALRIPVTHNGGGDSVMIDLDPAEGGTGGQVIWFSHEVGPEKVLARSWGEWLNGIAKELEVREYAE